MRGFIQKIWFWCDCQGWFIAKPLFRLLIWHRSGPVLSTNEEIKKIEQVKEKRRQARVESLRDLQREAADHPREDMVSIGVFACNRFDLLQRTCESLAAFLSEYGHNFKHEIMLFHDGENAEIEAWATKNPLFDRVFFNTPNHGLSKNINQFWFAESKGKYLMNLEDDWVCEFKDNFIQNGIEILLSNPNIGCVPFQRVDASDYRVWNEARKINTRVISENAFVTPNGHQYRILNKTVYGNSCTLYRYSSLVLAGRLRDDVVNRRAQEGEYMKRYNALWEGARGEHAKDSPFLHIGGGRSVSTWRL